MVCAAGRGAKGFSEGIEEPRHEFNQLLRLGLTVPNKMGATEDTKDIEAEFSAFRVLCVLGVLGAAFCAELLVDCVGRFWLPAGDLVIGAPVIPFFARIEAENSPLLFTESFFHVLGKTSLEIPLRAHPWARSQR